MSRPKIMFLGDAGSGKTQLAKVLIGESYSSIYKMTIGADFFTLNNKDTNLSITVWDMAGDERFSASGNAFYKENSAVFYCVDMTRPLNTKKIKSDIAEFKAICPNAAVVFVGTKSDLCYNTRECENKLNALNVSTKPFFTVSSAKNSGISALRGYIFTLVIPAHTETQYTAARKNLIDILDSMNDRIGSTKINNALGTLEHSLTQPHAKPEDKAAAIKTFTDFCSEMLKKQHPSLLQCALALAAVAAITVVAGLIGFGIGFALGCWTGPGAFFAGIAAGQAAAVAVLSTTVATTVVSSAALAVRFYRQAPVVIAADESGKEETYILH